MDQRHWPIDYAYEQLQKYRDVILAAEGVNEATTRLRAIDTLLFDVLGWDKRKVDTETYCREVGYADYVFSDAGGVVMVLEAKKDDITFLLKQSKIDDRAMGFAFLAKECPEADKALRQALGYAAALGAKYVAISNGAQWLLALTFVPHQPVNDRSVIAFESFEAIESRFRAFFDCFGPEGLRTHKSQELLLERRQAPPPTKLSHWITGYPVLANRNRMSNELSTVLATVWDEARDEEETPEFLKECYVEPETSASALGLAQELIEQRLSADQRTYSSTMQPARAAELLSSVNTEKPVVVLGNVGNGKTTFLRYLRLQKAKEVLDKYIQLDVNFIDRPDSADEVAGFIFDQIEEQLRSRHGVDLFDNALIRAALNADLNRFRRSPAGKAFENNETEFRREELTFIQSQISDRHNFLKKVFAHIRGSRQFSIAIFLDNLDRRTPEIQEAAYLKASAMARDWAAVVFVCLRPATFYRSKAFGVMDSVAPKVLTVSSPSAEPVIVKRLRFAAKYAKGEPLQREAADRGSARVPLSSRISMDLPKVAMFLETLANSFRRRHALVDLFEATSNGNTRELLAYIHSLLTSRHLDTQEIIEAIELDEHYSVPPHHALRAILFSDFNHYDPSRSAFLNLFDLQHSNPAEHFTRWTVIVYLMTVPDEHPTYRFALVADLVDHLQQCGYSSQHALWTLQYLFTRKCLESRDPVENWSDEVKAVRLTALGRYHIAVLAKEFAYVDAVTVDTPIIDEHARGRVGDVGHIRDRVNRCASFISYLDDASEHIGDSATLVVWRESRNVVNDRMRLILERIGEGGAGDW